ncbi:hypothetical protein BaRGS_00003613 [Batillaria attramentaria]|uniref:Rab9 effector protein with kelch motifs n=1 Tax=Batillaria attramentaria TaxID=370345 RepID=A0ABD0M008_9CAEN
MELHPFLEHDTRPNPGWWYVMTTAGDCPSMRVGHTCTYLPGQSESDAGKVYVIGGANPSGPFCETFVLDLNTRSWDTVDSPGLRPRYEHAAYVPPSHLRRIYVFGGANQAGNMNDLQVLDTVTNTWSTVTASGTPPAPRTHHTSAAVGDKLIIYSGGHQGADPVGDRQVHCFDASTDSWSTLSVRGDSPKPRHGHAMVSVGRRVFLHGGMAGSTFYDDLHILDLDKNTWVGVKKKRTFPSARAAHGMTACGTDVYVFGGMNREGALDDLYKLDTTAMAWTRIELQGPPPACRLDFALCVVELRVPRKGAPTQGTGELTQASGHAREVLEPSEAFFPIETADGATQDKSKAEETTTAQSTHKGENAEEGAAASAAEAETCLLDTVRVCLLNGGMDTEGEIFDDTLVFLL